MLELIFCICIACVSFMVGSFDQYSSFQDKCVAKYADMPHNKVGEYCTTLLKFERDPK
jgi:hypothetical protein